MAFVRGLGSALTLIDIALIAPSVPPSPAPPDVSASGIVGLLRHQRVLLRDELERQAAAAEHGAAPYRTALKTFEQQNRLAL